MAVAVAISRTRPVSTIVVSQRTARVMLRRGAIHDGNVGMIIICLCVNRAMLVLLLLGGENHRKFVSRQVFRSVEVFVTKMSHERPSHYHLSDQLDCK